MRKTQTTDTPWAHCKTPVVLCEYAGWGRCRHACIICLSLRGEEIHSRAPSRSSTVICSQSKRYALMNSAKCLGQRRNLHARVPLLSPRNYRPLVRPSPGCITTMVATERTAAVLVAVPGERGKVGTSWHDGGSSARQRGHLGARRQCPG